MARVQINKTGGRQYVQVVEYWRDKQGKAHTKVLKSFGALTGDPKEDAEKKGRARSYAANVNEAKAYAEDLKNEGKEKPFIETILGIVFGLIIGAAVISFILWLTGDQKE